MLGSLSVLISADDVAIVVDSECLCLHGTGKIKLLEVAVSPPHKAMLDTGRRGGKRTDNRPGLGESDRVSVGHVRLRIGEGQDEGVTAQDVALEARLPVRIEREPAENVAAIIDIVSNGNRRTWRAVPQTEAAIDV